MTLERASLVAAARFAVLYIGVTLLAVPARLLRPRYYPNGLDGTVVFIIMMTVIIAVVLIMVTWVSAPLKCWHQQNIADMEHELKDYRSTSDL